MTRGEPYTTVSLEAHEHVVATIRQGLVGIVPRLILPSLFIIAPFFLLFLLFSYGTVGSAVFFLLLGIGATLAARRFYLWRHQLMIITNQRVVDVDCRGVFKKTVSSAPLSHMSDAYYETAGILQSLSMAGNIIVIFNNGKTKFEFRNTPHPEQTLKILHDAHKRCSINFDGATVSVSELLEMMKKIKNKLGEKKFRELVADGGEQE